MVRVVTNHAISVQDYTSIFMTREIKMRKMIVVSSGVANFEDFFLWIQDFLGKQHQIKIHEQRYPQS